MKPRSLPGQAPVDPQVLEQRLLATQALINARQMRGIFLTVVGLLFIQWLRQQADFSWMTQLGYGLIALAALLPLYLWMTGKVPGIPIYPTFSFFQFMAFGLPLLSFHPGITNHSPDAHLAAAAIVSAALTCGTIGWLVVGNSVRPPLAFCRQLEQANGDRLLVAAIFAALIFATNTVVEWIPIPAGLYSVVRGVVGGISTLAIFALGQHLGQGKLQGGLKFCYIALVVSLFMVQVATLLLINAFSVAILALAGYTLGKRKIPWIMSVVTVLVISFLHIGKAPVRTTYWGENRESTIQSPGDAIGMFDFWIESSFDSLSGKNQDEEKNEKASAFDRASLMHLFLMQKEMTDHYLPHLEGETYWLVPGLLIPRFLNPNKVWSQEGTTLLNIHFGLQTRETSMTTTIGWGLINEGYANFGFWGACGICFVVGAFTGWVTLLSQGLPFLSFRSLIAILVLSTSFQTEFSLGVLVASLFQSFVGFFAFNLVFMKTLPTLEFVRFIEARTQKARKRRNLAV